MKTKQTYTQDEQSKFFAIGLDTIEINIETEFELIENKHEFVSPNTGIVVGTLTHKRGKEHGYRLNICLPKCIRETNVKPITVLDVFHLFEITSFITNEMQRLFGENYPELVVSTAEVNCTAQLSDKRNIEPLLNMFAHMMLTKHDKLFVCVHGMKSGKRYQPVSTLASGMQVESLRTPLLSNDRCALKVYNKGLEQNIKDKGLLRIEAIFNRKGLDYARAGRTLQEFLTVNSIKNLLSVYRTDYRRYVVDRFWNNNGRPFYRQCVDIIYNDLVKFGGNPLTVALINRSIIEFDFGFFVKACKKYYKKNNSALKAISRVKKSGELKIYTGVVNDFVRISKAIVYG